jgi:hypothetical protein
MNTFDASRDLVGARWARTVWCALAIVALVGAFAPAARALLWTASFAVSGILCLVNAIRSRRFHCMYTGPIYLAGAVATLARASGLVAWPWAWIGCSVLVGVLGALVWERLRGAPDAHRCC